MLTFFRVNDPYRMLGVCVLLLLIRLPFWLSDTPLTLPELSWMLLGERLAEGHRLYVGVWDDVGPLSAAVYGTLEMLLDRQRWVYTGLAALLTIYQSLVFNDFLRARKAYRESTYVPALVYGLLMSLSFDFYTLSPVLMSLTWVLLAFRNTFDRIEGTLRDGQILRSGIFVGVAALFHLPTLLFIVPIFYAYMLFASLSPRRSLLLLYGVVLPFAVALTYFYLTETAGAFVYQYVLAFGHLASHHYVNGVTLLIILAVALVFFALSLYHVTQYRRFTIQQAHLQQVMFVNTVVALLALLWVQELAPFHLLLFVPPFAFFITHYLLIIQRMWQAELATALLVILLPLSGYALLFNYFSINQIAHTEALLVQPTAYDALVTNKRVLVLGDNLSIYQNAKPATPYLNWQIASNQLNQMNYFENLSEVYINFTADMPDLIIDQANLMPSISERIPVIRNAYQRQQNQVYVKQ
ncbi:MAG: hypothetical protein WA958_01805 [Tunicatimonas sp.]